MEGIQIAVETGGIRRDIQVVRIAGYIDTTTSSELERVIQNLLREQQFKIIIDLKDVDYISSAGWGIFISEIKNIRTHRGDLKLACMSETVNEVYELLEFSTILTSANTVEDALRLFGDDGAAAAAQGPTAPAAKPAVKPAVPPWQQPAAAASPQPPSASPAKPPARPGMTPQPQGGAPAASRLQPAPSAPPGSTAGRDPVSRPAGGMQATPPAGPKPGLEPPQAAPQPGAPAAAFGLLPLIDRIRILVKAHPDWGAWTLKKELNRRRGTQPKVSWGEVRAELKYNDLGSKKERFKFARKMQA
ncbi:STAS domain-containing protein [candidate division FCPU426 bacterium]|nr:STAS domain-containing protein [candidate division FCPU426 bacterium]